jgi:hypothetical protein
LVLFSAIFENDTGILLKLKQGHQTCIKQSSEDRNSHETPDHYISENLQYPEMDCKFGTETLIGREEMEG